MVLFSVWFFFGSPLTGVFQELLYEASVIDMFHGAWMLYCLYCLSKVSSMRYMIMWLDFSLGLFGKLEFGADKISVFVVARTSRLSCTGPC